MTSLMAGFTQRVAGMAVALGAVCLCAAAPAAQFQTARVLGSATREHAPQVARPAVNHSAPYTRLLGTDWPSSPVRLADHKTIAAPAAATGSPVTGTGAPAAGKVPARTVGFHHWGRPYYAGYGGYPGSFGSPYAYGFGYTYPYYAGYAGYGGYPYGAYNVYRPYVYQYQPWIGGWGGYPYYSSFAPGFGGYYGASYRGYGGYGGYGAYGGYGGYSGCCYW